MKRPLFIIMLGMIGGEISVVIWGGWAFLILAFVFPGMMIGFLVRHFLPVYGPGKKAARMIILLGAFSFLAGQFLYYEACKAKGVEEDLYGSHIKKSWLCQKKDRDSLLHSPDLFSGRKEYECGKSSERAGLKGEIRGRVQSLRKKEETVTLILKRGARFSGNPRPLSGKCILTGLSDDLLPGDEIQASGTLVPLEEVENPGSFPVKIHRLSEGIRTAFRANQARIVKRPLLSFPGIGYRIQRRLGFFYGKFFNPTEQALLKAMVLGDQSDLPQEERTLYEENGAAHLLSLSGLHVSIIAGRVFRFLRKRKKTYGLSCIISFFVIIFYGLIVSGGSSLVRASLMFSTFLFAEYVGAEYDMVSAMSLAMILMLAESPFRLLDGGCIISFLYIFIIGMILPRALELRRKRGGEICTGTAEKEKRRKRERSLYKRMVSLCPREIAGNLKESFFSSLILSAAAGPVIMALYYEWSPFSILLNLLILPAMVPLMMSALAGGILYLSGSAVRVFLNSVGCFFETAAIPVCWPAAFIIRLFHFLFVLVRRIPAALIVTGHLSLWQIGLIYGLEFIIFYLWYQRAWRRLFAGAVIVLIVFSLPSGQVLDITMLSVGQGDSILVMGPDGSSLLIDSGSSSEKEIGRYTLLPALKYYGLVHLDGVVITHFDEDHISGIRDILKSGYPIGCLLVGNDPDLDDPNRREILKLAREKGTPVRTLARGDSFHLGEVSLECINPPESITSPHMVSTDSPSHEQERDRNARSVVLYMVWKDFDSLFTGDIGEEEENEIAAWIKEKKRGSPMAYPMMKDGVTFLKCAHHGSPHSSTDRILAEIRPACVGISAGRKNRYGHPAETTLARLRNCGSRRILCSKWGGAICLKTDGIKTRISYWK